MADAPADEQPDAPEGEVEAPPEPPTRYGVPLSVSGTQDVVHPDREGLASFVMALRDEHGFTMCLDVTAVDFADYGAARNLPEAVSPERFELVYHFISHTNRERLRARVQVPDDDPTAPSLFDVHPGVEAMEREVYDMFGITFEGHPDPSRILMPEDWVGHPLRKDFSMGRIPVQFKAAENVRGGS